VGGVLQGKTGRNAKQYPAKKQKTKTKHRIIFCRRGEKRNCENTGRKCQRDVYHSKGGERSTRRGEKGQGTEKQSNHLLKIRSTSLWGRAPEKDGKKKEKQKGMMSRGETTSGRHRQGTAGKGRGGKIRTEKAARKGTAEKNRRRSLVVLVLHHSKESERKLVTWRFSIKGCGIHQEDECGLRSNTARRTRENR